MDKDRAKLGDAQRNLGKRNRLKWFSSHIAGLLYYNNPNSPLRKSYQNSFHCADSFQVKEGKLIQHYCKVRWCQTCIRIKMGTMINRYAPRLEQEQLYFVTLTRPNVPAGELKQELDSIYNTFRGIIKNRWFYRFLKDGGIGIRKTECTYNPERDDYHPHFHILLSDKGTAEKLLADWLRLNPTASPDAQDLKQVKGKGGILEVFKYFTKLLAKDNSGRRFFDPIRMNVIFEAMNGRRVYQRLGTTASWGCDEVTEEDENQYATLDYPEGREGEIFKWLESEDFYGWYSIETGDTLVESKKTRLHEVFTEVEDEYGTHKFKKDGFLEWVE